MPSPTFQKREMTRERVGLEIRDAEEALVEDGARGLNLWTRIRVEPVLWVADQYPGVPSVWVMALMGTRCLYFNPLESGWGWGRYEVAGRVSEYHCEQESLAIIVFMTLSGIDEGGAG